MSWRLEIPCSFIALGLQAVCASAGTCDLPGRVISPLNNGSLLALTSDGWSDFRGFQALTGPATLSFAYVVKPWFGERAGVVIIKTARVRPSKGDRSPGAIRLVRNESSAAPGCTSAAFSPRSVAAQAYEDYHGLGYSESKSLDAASDDGERNMSVIGRFHSKYQTARSCRSTDDIKDENNNFEYRNNRSQFSYDTNIVDNGWQYSLTTLAWSLVPSVLAAPSKLRDQQTEIRHYKTGPVEPECIKFQVSASGSDQVLRINDLEDRDKANIIRAPELRWPPDLR